MAPLWMHVGCSFEVVQRAVYEHKDQTYELPTGARGIVAAFDKSGDARVEWKVTDGVAVPISKWLLQSSFSKVRILDPLPIPADFTILLKMENESQGFGLAVDRPGYACLLIKAVRAEGLMATYNQTAPPERQVCPGDLIVHVNGIYGDSEKMLEQVSSGAEEVIVAVRKKNPLAAPVLSRTSETSVASEPPEPLPLVADRRPSLPSPDAHPVLLTDFKVEKQNPISALIETATQDGLLELEAMPDVNTDKAGSQPCACAWWS